MPSTDSILHCLFESETTSCNTLAGLSKDLLQGEKLNERAKRGWIRINDGTVKPLGDRNKPGDIQTFLIHAWTQSKSVEQSKVVDYQQGRLTIPTARRIEKSEQVTGLGFRAKINAVRSTEHVAWFDPKVHPACAAAKIVFKQDARRRRSVQQN